MARRTEPFTLPDLSGKRVVLTGGSDGMGLVMATQLAAAGADLVLPVRNARKGEAAITTIRESAPKTTVSLRSLELSSLSSVAALGETLRDEGAPIDIFIGNAGVMNPPARQVTSDGFELQVGTNHLGHVALIGHLMPLLRAGRARVTLQISVAADQGAIKWDDLNWERSYDSMGAYSQSKIAYGLFGLELDRRSREAGWGITANLSHPGVAPRCRTREPPRRAARDRTIRARALTSTHLAVLAPRRARHPGKRRATPADGRHHARRPGRPVLRAERIPRAQRGTGRAAALLAPAQPRRGLAHLDREPGDDRGDAPGGVTKRGGELNARHRLSEYRLEVFGGGAAGVAEVDLMMATVPRDAEVRHDLVVKSREDGRLIIVRTDVHRLQRPPLGHRDEADLIDRKGRLLDGCRSDAGRDVFGVHR